MKGAKLAQRWRFDCRQLPKLIKEFHPEVILALGNIGVTLAGYKQAILIHKPHLLYPAKYYHRELYLRRGKNWLLKQRLKKCLPYTDLIFCQTPVTQKRFAQTFRFPPDKIRIMPMAVSAFAQAAGDQRQKPQVFDQKGYFNLVFLSRFYAHKNFEVLIPLFRDHLAKLKNVRCIITIGPEQHANAPKFLADIDRYHLQEHSVNVGPLKQEEIAGYFCNADAFISPTLLETFGLPYLEAMHFSLPILTSDLDFARYVCADAAIYFDPWNPADIAEKILLMKNKPQLRQEIADKGNQRVATFFKSWQEIVGGVIKQLELLANQ